MKSKETRLLEEAYLAIRKSPKIPSAVGPADKETVTANPNPIVSTGPLDEPAPGVKMDMIDSKVSDVEPEDKDTTGVPVSMAVGGMDHETHSELEDHRFEEEDENEEDQMSIDNLNSIRESLMKIASHCAMGDHLEPWQQQKLAIAMDNLAEVARRLPRKC